ncbi:MAG: NAD(P)-binding domain-containing protein, partial [Actinobacteria bacterium]|nr:NAD(P)-binding domain-containing protein [Actinomycetota bacterium]
RPVAVESVREGGSGSLVVESEAGTWRTRALINATGTWTKPFWPHYPGMETFRGRHLHTADYPGPGEFSGRHVVVVGGGHSAVQHLAELSEVTTTTWVTRRPPRWRETPFDREAGRQAVAKVAGAVAAGRRPGLRAEDLLRARADRHRGAGRLRRGRGLRRPAPAHPRSAPRPALLRGHPHRDRARAGNPGHRLDLGQGLVGLVVGVAGADARILPHRLSALRVLHAAALLHRGPRAPGTLRLGVRDRRRCVRAAELRRGAHGRGLHPPAHLRDHRRRDAGRHVPHLPGGAGRRGPALRHAVEVRDGLQERDLQAARPAAHAGRRRAGSRSA